ncbi:MULTISPECIES: hypothetical protein [unclassified Avibacterium]|uniref:hypothetical protein n=1 Tax=unclassified Avibacterium TaxID=2685287 RepID=UPI002025DCB5|nr:MULTISPECIES: hypothetical protein [unclassified Avibacterium]MCW9716013.1 hypothetical protein [Avibacterium sp. 21-594]MCW9734069.1 hypothetical protein [Avibacterium sp. 20-15]URL01360.1 hypothetical protein L4F91_07390 [Avibacterium sp. 20-126]URL03716.1 hypothetical protein L4F93_09095 [Avibacterium sp. 20-132]
MEKEKKTTVGTFTQDPTKSIVKVQITRRIPDGVYVWVETEGWGHAYIMTSIDNHITVYTYGRYDDVDFWKITGEGVLGKFEDCEAILYMKSSKHDSLCSVYKILDITPCKVLSILNFEWSRSNEKPNNPEKFKDNPKIKNLWITKGHVIDTYAVYNRNCTTITIDTIEKAGSNLFSNLNKTEEPLWSILLTPAGLQNYLENSNNSAIVKNITQYMKLTLFPG